MKHMTFINDLDPNNMSITNDPDLKHTTFNDLDLKDMTFILTREIIP